MLPPKTVPPIPAATKDGTTLNAPASARPLRASAVAPPTSPNAPIAARPSRGRRQAISPMPAATATSTTAMAPIRISMAGGAAFDAADDQVEALLEDWEPAKVALLTTGHRHPEQKAQFERHGPVAYWRSFWEGEDVFYGHVLGSKGLEREVVVLRIEHRRDAYR